MKSINKLLLNGMGARRECLVYYASRQYPIKLDRSPLVVLLVQMSALKAKTFIWASISYLPAMAVSGT